MNLAGKKEAFLRMKSGITKLWDCDDVGEIKEYVGLKVE
jgi:hypothetical protein